MSSIIIKNKKTINVDSGSNVSYEVDRPHYTSTNGHVDNILADTTVPVNLPPIMHNLTLNVDPVDCDIEMSPEVEPTQPQEGTYVYSVLDGTKLSYTVSHFGYYPQSGVYTMDKSYSKNITLQRMPPMYTLLIVTNPSNAKVVLKAEGYNQYNNSITVPEGTEVEYTVSANLYVTQTGSITVLEKTTETITLAHKRVKLTIVPTPSDATVTFDKGVVSGKTTTVDAGEKVTYTVSRSLLETQSGTITLYEDTTKEVSLNYAKGTVLFKSSNPGTYTLNLPLDTEVKMRIVGAGGGGAAYLNQWFDPCSSIFSRFSGYWYTDLRLASGGGGGYIEVNTKLSKGSHSIRVGAGGLAIKGLTSDNYVSSEKHSYVDKYIAYGGGHGITDPTQYGVSGVGSSANGQIGDQYIRTKKEFGHRDVVPHATLTDYRAGGKAALTVIEGENNSGLGGYAKYEFDSNSVSARNGHNGYVDIVVK